MAKGRCEVYVDLEVPKEVKQFVENNEERVAQEIEAKAKASSEFADKTGTLRKRIKAKKSRYVDGGYIVEARAPHAHLVEFGHEIIDWRTGKRIGFAPAKSFLRKAKEQTINDAIRMFGAK